MIIYQEQEQPAKYIKSIQKQKIEPLHFTNT